MGGKGKKRGIQQYEILVLIGNITAVFDDVISGTTTTDNARSVVNYHLNRLAKYAFGTRNPDDNKIFPDGKHFLELKEKYNDADEIHAWSLVLQFQPGSQIYKILHAIPLGATATVGGGVVGNGGVGGNGGNGGVGRAPNPRPQGSNRPAGPAGNMGGMQGGMGGVNGMQGVLGGVNGMQGGMGNGMGGVNGMQGMRNVGNGMQGGGRGQTPMAMLDEMSQTFNPNMSNNNYPVYGQMGGGGQGGMQGGMQGGIQGGDVSEIPLGQSAY